MCLYHIQGYYGLGISIKHGYESLKACFDFGAFFPLNRALKFALEPRPFNMIECLSNGKEPKC